MTAKVFQQLAGPGQGALDRGWANKFANDIKNIFRSIFEGDITLGGRLITRSGRIMNVRRVTATPDTLKLTDERVDVNVASAVAMTLPANPETGQTIVVNDGSGAASSNNITVSAPGGVSLNGSVAGSLAITANYGRREFMYNGIQWIGS